MSVSSSLLAITLDPFCKPYKRLRDTLEEARRRQFEIVVALDDRTCADCYVEFVRLDLPVVTFKSPGYCEAAFKFVARCTRDFVLRIDDDERPSTALWEFAANPPTPARFGIPVIPILGDKIWRPDVGLPERLFWRDGWRWVGGFNGHSESPVPNIVIDRNPGVLIWHYLLEAPREEREAKAARYAELDPTTDHRSRLIYEDRPDQFDPRTDIGSETSLRKNRIRALGQAKS